MEIQVNKIWESVARTLSDVRVNGFIFSFALEDGFRPVKVPGETRIPPGRYKIVKRTHGKFYDQYRKKYGHKFAIEIQGVPGFSDILIHIGNTPKDTRGCILVGFGILKDKSLGKAPDLISSESAYLALYDLLEKEFEKGIDSFIEVNR